MPVLRRTQKSDEDGLIAWRGTHVFAIMNLYPYNVGHLMICPYRHVGFITELDDAELFEFEKATTLAMKVMETVSRPDGYNIGINQARSRVPESPRTCTSMWCRVGMAMRTSCPSSPRRVPCRFCCPTSEMPMPGIRTAGPAVSFAACLTGCGTRATGFIGTRNKTIIGNITGMSD